MKPRSDVGKPKVVDAESNVSKVGRTIDELLEVGAIAAGDFERADFPRLAGDDCAIAGGAYNFTPV